MSLRMLNALKFSVMEALTQFISSDEASELRKYILRKFFLLCVIAVYQEMK